MEPAAEGNAAGRGDFAAAGQPVPALVRQGVSRAEGPAQWAKAKLVRYADDFVVLARYQSPELRGLDRIEAGRLAGVGDQSGEDAGGEPEGRGSESGLSGIHVSVRPGPARATRNGYLNVSPSEKALKQEREKLQRDEHRGRRCNTGRSRLLIGELNRHLKGWTNYFRFGYPRVEPSGRSTRTFMHRLTAAPETAQPTALPTAGRDQLL